MLMPRPTVILSAIPQTSDRLNSRRNLDAMYLSLAPTHSVPVVRSDSGHATIGVFAMTLHENGLLARCDLFALLDDLSIGRCRILDADTARPLDSDRIKIVERLMLIIGTRGEWNIAGDGAIKQMKKGIVSDQIGKESGWERGWQEGVNLVGDG